MNNIHDDAYLKELHNKCHLHLLEAGCDHFQDCRHHGTSIPLGDCAGHCWDRHIIATAFEIHAKLEERKGKKLKA